jgi:putative DNA primase/helicase
MSLPTDIQPITKEFGPPGYENSKHKLARLNEIFWAAYYARQATKLIYEPNEKEFYSFDTDAGIFAEKSSDVIRTELAALILHAARTWDSSWLPLEQFRSAQNLSGAIAHLRGQVEARDFFNETHRLVHLKDCTLRLNSDGKFVKEDFSPLHKNRNRSPINYDPKATCPKFEQHILGHLPEDDRALLKKYAGQCLLGRNLTQRVGILDGVGGASKGAFILILSGIIGCKSVYELRTKWLGERFEIGRMIGRTLLVGSDVKGNFLYQEGANRIKSMVGGDALEAERKQSNNCFTVYGIFNLLVSSNARLRLLLEGDRSAWERRLFIVRYDKPFEGKRIFEIEKYLLEREAPGILNWCLTGLKMLFQDYEQAGDIILSPNQKNRVDVLLSESDSLRLFIQDNIIKTQATSPDSLTTEEIIAEYINDAVNTKGWVPVPQEYAEKQLPALIAEFFGLTKSHDIKRNGKNRRGFWNLRFKP